MQAIRNSKGQFVKGSKSRLGISHTEKSKRLISVHKQGQVSWNKGKEHLRGEKHPKWKGDNVGYGALHDWVILRLGKANHCEKDKNHTAPLYHWANKSGLYKRELNDWWSLCPSCNKTDGVTRKNIFNERRQRILVP